MAKLLSEYIMLKQETTHLILSLLIVSYSHRFIQINLRDDCNLLDIGGMIANTENNEYAVHGRTIIVKLIVTMYGQRMIRDSWSCEKMYNETLSFLDTINLRYFCAKFQIG